MDHKLALTGSTPERHRPSRPSGIATSSGGALRQPDLSVLTGQGQAQVDRINPGRVASGYAEHGAIAEAVIRGDTAAAARLIEKHPEYGKCYLLSPRRSCSHLDTRDTARWAGVDRTETALGRRLPQYCIRKKAPESASRYSFAQCGPADRRGSNCFWCNRCPGCGRWWP